MGLGEYFERGFCEVPEEFIAHVRSPEAAAWLEKRLVEEAEERERHKKNMFDRMRKNNPLITTKIHAMKILGASSFGDINHRPVDGTEGWWYFWIGNRGGKQAIITESGESLCAGSAISYEELLEAFKEGKRNDNS